MQFTEEELIKLKDFIPMQEAGILGSIRTNIKHALAIKEDYKPRKLYEVACEVISKEAKSG